MNDTPTPRSDAAELTEPYEIRALGFCVVHIDDARQLERELTEALDHVEHMKKYCMMKVGALQKQTCARMLAEFQRDALAKALRMCQREMLEVLRDLHDDRQPLDGDDFHEALEKTEEALATLDRTL